MTGNRQIPVVSVSELTAAVKHIIEDCFPLVAVRGEISNLSPAASGHVYFSLKDGDAQMPAAIWRTNANNIRFRLHDGLEVVALGGLQVYPPRGGYQLIIEELRPEGIGPLELAFRQLREKLSREGLFDPARKRPLPTFPQRIALVTSPTGAAIRDLIQVVSRRWTLTDLVIVPVPVQGEGAAERIATGLRDAAKLGVDLIICARGGGSLEDLWAFNEEPVARAIFASEVPVVSAIGHETDVTIADLAADLRAATPSEAAELVVPDGAAIRDELEDFGETLPLVLRNRAVAARGLVDALADRTPFRRPMAKVEELRTCAAELARRASATIKQAVRERTQQLASSSRQLAALSPLATLERGYSVSRNAEDGTVLTDASDIKVGDRIATSLAQGELLSRVESKASD